MEQMLVIESVIAVKFYLVLEGLELDGNGVIVGNHFIVLNKNIFNELWWCSAGDEVKVETGMLDHVSIG